MANEGERQDQEMDERMKYAKQRQGEGEGDRSGPSPYDQASPDMPEDRVIKKGKREKPGPTQDELREQSRASRTGAGGGGPAEEEDLGGGELHERMNRPSEDDKMMGDEESA